MEVQLNLVQLLLISLGLLVIVPNSEKIVLMLMNNFLKRGEDDAKKD
jgi:hypothetical protein